MADDNNTNNEAGADLPDDLKRLLDRASAEDDGTDVYVESDDEAETTTAKAETKTEKKDDEE